MSGLGINSLWNNSGDGMLPGHKTLKSSDTPDSHKLQGQDCVGKECSMNLSAFQTEIPQHLSGMVFLCPRGDPSRSGTISRGTGF